MTARAGSWAWCARREQRVSRARVPCAIAALQIKSPQPKQDRSKLWRLAHLLTQHTCLGIGLLHLGRCLPFGHLQGCAEGDVQGQGMLGMCRRLWQGREERDPGREVANRFQMGRTLTARSPARCQ